MVEKEGKIINIKIEKDLHKKLKIEAVMQGKTIKDLTASIIKDYIDRRKI